MLEYTICPLISLYVTVERALNRVQIKLLAGVAIAALFIGGVERVVGWGPLLAPWAEMSWPALAGALLLTFFSYALRAARMYDYFHAEMRGAFGLTFKLVLQHNLLNNFLPMRAGEISFPVLARRYFQIPPIKTVPVLFWFRLLDLHTLALFALLGLGGRFMPLWLVALAGVLWLLLPPLFFLSHRRLQRWSRGKGEAGFYKLLHKALSGLPQSAGEFWRSWGWTLLNWAVKLAVFGWLLAAFVTLPVTALITGVIGGDLTSVLPIHGVAGMGTYEAGVVMGAAFSGVTVEALLQGAVNLHLFVLGASLLGGGVSLLPWGRCRQG